MKHTKHQVIKKKEKNMINNNIKNNNRNKDNNNKTLNIHIIIHTKNPKNNLMNNHKDINHMKIIKTFQNKILIEVKWHQKVFLLNIKKHPNYEF